eukprot:9470276-Pyramimonas_sp.AAC.2
MTPRAAREAPERPQEAPKKLHRSPQEAPKRSPRGPKARSICPQEPSKKPLRGIPRAPHIHPRSS